MAHDDDASLGGRLFELFLEEIEEQLERMAAGVERLAGAQGETPAEVVDDLFRSAHTVKGAAQAVGEQRVAGACHELEDLLAGVRDGVVVADHDLVGGVTQLVDTISRETARLPGRTTNAAEVQGTGAPLPEQHSPRDSDTEWAADAGPPAAGEGQPLTAVPRPRTEGKRVEVLMEEAAALLVASHGADDVLASLTRTEQSLARDLLNRQREFRRVVKEAGLADHQPIEQTIRSVEQRTELLCRELGEVRALLTRHHRTLRVSAHRFQEAARRVRMVPFAQVTVGLDRMVRELAAELHKEAEFRVTADEVEVDRDFVLMLREVLGHLVRNALDHGIEPPATRERLGKPRQGRVEIRASLQSDGVRVEVSDDGAGLDLERLRRASALVMSTADGDDLPVTEAMFAPGVSTSTRVSSVSGRGVGLDVVRTTVEGTCGTVSVQSEPGQGTRLSLVLPLTLSTMRVLLVQAAGETLAVPSAAVSRLVSLPPATPRLDGTAVMSLDQELLTVAPLHRIMGWEPTEERSRADTGLVIAGPARAAVLSVEAVLSERSVVLHASSSRLDGARELLGTTQLDDGSVVLVLNPAACVRFALADRAQEATAPGHEAPGRRSVLLAEDSLTSRELERSLLEAAGYDVLVAHDGRQAWDLLQQHGVDAVVSDVNMPRMDGIALCRAIRDSARLAHLPVVLVTALHSEADRRAGLESGADAYLTKVGFNRDQLLDALDRLL